MGVTRRPRHHLSLETVAEDIVSYAYSVTPARWDLNDPSTYSAFEASHPTASRTRIPSSPLRMMKLFPVDGLSYSFALSYFSFSELRRAPSAGEVSKRRDAAADSAEDVVLVRTSNVDVSC